MAVLGAMADVDFEGSGERCREFDSSTLAMTLPDFLYLCENLVNCFRVDFFPNALRREIYQGETPRAPQDQNEEIVIPQRLQMVD